MADLRLTTMRHSWMNAVPAMLLPRRHSFDGPPIDSSAKIGHPAEVVSFNTTTGIYTLKVQAISSLAYVNNGITIYAYDPFMLAGDYGASHQRWANGTDVIVLFTPESNPKYLIIHPTLPVLPVAATPWGIFQWTPAAPSESACTYTYWRNVRVHLGYVNGEKPYAAKFCHEQDPNLPTGSNAGSAYDILVPASTTDYKIWGHATYTRAPFCSQSQGGIIITDLKIEHGTSWWSGHPAQYPTAGEFFFEIGTCTTTADQLPYTNCPTNTIVNPSYPPVLTINQIVGSDQFIYAQPMLFVTLSSTGGVAGDKSTPCSFVYTATDICGEKVGTSLTPQNSRARILNAPTTAATQGTVYWDASGALQLWDANETLAQYSCPAPGTGI